jgi:hypothetical protein
MAAKCHLTRAIDDAVMAVALVFVDEARNASRKGADAEVGRGNGGPKGPLDCFAKDYGYEKEDPDMARLYHDEVQLACKRERRPSKRWPLPRFFPVGPGGAGPSLRLGEETDQFQKGRIGNRRGGRPAGKPGSRQEA